MAPPDRFSGTVAPFEHATVVPPFPEIDQVSLPVGVPDPGDDGVTEAVNRAAWPDT